jgi:peptide/nickel transport system substrate-binding protein
MMRRRKRSRPFVMVGLTGVVVAVALVVLAAIGGVGQGSAAPSQATASATTLVDAVPDDAVSFDMFFALSLTSAEAVMNSYDAFTTYQHKGASNGIRLFNPAKVTGMGLVSVTPSENLRVWTLRVRRAKHVNGDPVTSADVKYMMDRNFGVKGSAAKFLYQFLGRIKSKTSIKIIDQHTVRVTTTAPNALLPYLFTLSNSVVPNSKVLKANAGKDGWAQEYLKRNTAGSGPYQVQSWTPGSQVVLRANENYWAGAPPIKQVTIRIVPSAANRVALLKRGEVDIVERLTPAEVETLEGTQGIRTVSVPGASQVTLAMDNKVKPFSDVRVRRAIAYATPYSDIIRTAYRGRARPTAGPVATNFPGHYEAGYPYKKQNLARAKQLLTEAGYADGFDVDLAHSTGDPNHQAAAILIGNALQSIGIKVNIRPLTPAVFAERTGKHQLRFFLQNVVWWVPDPAYAMALGYACNQFFNYWNYCNKNMDKALNRAFVQPNRRARTRAFQQLQKMIWTDSPVVWITQPNINLAMRSNISGYRSMNDELLRFAFLRKT